VVATSDVKPLLFVTVGTDHHPFDRLLRWIDAWLAAGGKKRVRCLVQRGTSIPSSYAESSDYLEYDAMGAAMRDAAAVVCHGGPGTILLAADAGKVPIVVPRLHALGEHVDDHQLIFARRMASEGTVALAEREDRFRALADEALTAPVTPAPAASFVADALRRFEKIVDELMLRERDRVARSSG
jgi:UDP-N-acetylglucosamine transferase subunit ALG13